MLLADFQTHLDLKEVFGASPVIYSILLALSLFSFVLWSYALLTLSLPRLIPAAFAEQMRGHLLAKRYDTAYEVCQNAKHTFASILASGIAARKHGYPVMLESMQMEGKRCGVLLWQKISLLNDIAIIAPMLGLLGTVVGLFYAFYDVQRTPDTLASIFDGLGIAVGTTVAGLVVAIFAMIFATTLKFRVITLLGVLENEAMAFGNLIETTP